MGARSLVGVRWFGGPPRASVSIVAPGEYTRIDWMTQLGEPFIMKAPDIAKGMDASVYWFFRPMVIDKETFFRYLWRGEV